MFSGGSPCERAAVHRDLAVTYITTSIAGPSVYSRERASPALARKLALTTDCFERRKGRVYSALELRAGRLLFSGGFGRRLITITARPGPDYHRNVVQVEAVFLWEWDFRKVHGYISVRGERM